MLESVIRPCSSADAEAICAIINDAAEAYRGVIPADCWREPYMPRGQLEEEIDSGVAFWGYEQTEELLGIMGLQNASGVWLIRHAYVRPSHQRQGIGKALLERLRAEAWPPLLVGTWAAAAWAIRFYESQGFRRANLPEKDELLRRYWTVSERQRKESVVLQWEQ